MTSFRLLAPALALVAVSAWCSDVQRRTANDGQLILEDIPEISSELADSLNRFQMVNSNSFVEWTADSSEIYVSARTGDEDVSQLHRVREPGAERQPMTFSQEPIGEVKRQYEGRLLAFTKDRGGNGFDQIYLLDPANGTTRLLTDGKSLNNRMVWDHDDRRLAYRSTRRNGRSNDIWVMDVNHPEQAKMVYQAPDGALWKPVSFSRDGRLLLVQQYAGITDSRIHLLDLETGSIRQLVGLPDMETSNVAIDFDHDDKGAFFVTNQRGGAAEIGWVPLAEGELPAFVRHQIPWDVTEFELSPNGRRGAFVTNEDGISRLYLFESRRMIFKPVKGIPIGIISDLRFSPNGRRLGFTLEAPDGPADAYSLRLGFFATSAGKLERWTRGGVDGLDTSDFVVPRLIRFPAPGLTPETPFQLPAFLFMPRGKGPFPVVIYIHGGPESQFRPGFNSIVQMWVTRLGVAVVAPNVRGSLGYGRAYLSLDDGRRREDSVRDIGALLDWIAKTSELDASHVAVFGASYGGYMALACAVHYSDRLVAAVDRSGISNFVTYLENTQGYRRDLRRFEYGDERDPEMRAFLESISPLNNVDRISIPMLIAQGQNDPIVPATESKQMVQALRDRGQTVWYMNALNEGHGYERKENRDIYQQVTYMFLQRYLVTGDG